MEAKQRFQRIRREGSLFLFLFCIFAIFYILLHVQYTNLFEQDTFDNPNYGWNRYCRVLNFLFLTCTELYYAQHTIFIFIFFVRL